MSPLIIIAAVGSVLIAISVPLAALYFSHKRRELWHQTARIALEKGQPLPPVANLNEDFDDIPPLNANFAEWQAARRAEARSHAIKGGLVLVALAAGLQLFLYSIRSRIGWVGAIPGFIGLALLAHAAFEAWLSKTTAPRPPQS